MRGLWDKEEVLRYLGASRSDTALDGMIARAQEEIERASQPRQTYRLFPADVDDTGVSLRGARLESSTLAAHLKGCREAYLFAFTLGPGVDRVIKRYTVTEMPLVPVLQACAAAWTEALADQAQTQLEAEAKERGLYLRPRYSPGYGDFPLTAQRFLFDALEVTKRTGITLTESCLMLPTKSITAVIGLSPDPSLCHVGRCMSCTAQNCPFRKKETSHE